MKVFRISQLSILHSSIPEVDMAHFIVKLLVGLLVGICHINVFFNAITVFASLDGTTGVSDQPTGATTLSASTAPTAVHDLWEQVRTLMGLHLFREGDTSFEGLKRPVWARDTFHESGTSANATSDHSVDAGSCSRGGGEGVRVSN